MTTTTPPALATKVFLRHLVRDALVELEPADPKEITADVLASLTDEQVHEAAYHGICELAVEESRKQRREYMLGRTVGSARVANAVAHADVFRMRVSLPHGEFRFLADCDRADLAATVALLEDKARSISTVAAKFAALRDVMPDVGCVVSVLSREAVEMIFDA